MAINTSIYGTSEQWIDSSFNRYITNKNKVAYFAANASRLENGVSANKLSYSTPIDKSLSYCGLGTESALSHIGYIYKVGGTYGVQEWQDSFVTNFAFFQQNSTNIDMSQSINYYKFNDNTIYKSTTWQATQEYPNVMKYLQPYTLINPLSFVLCIYIRCCNAALTDWRDVDLKTYMTTYKTSHPYIICAYIQPFFNNQAWTENAPRRTISGDTETSLNGNLRTMSYGRLDSYKCEGKNFEAYNYYLCDCTVFGFFCRAEGLIYDDKMFFIMATENCKSHVHTYLTGGDHDYLAAYIEYFDGIEEEILKTVACFGLYFTPSATVATSGKLTNNDMYIGLLDENGIGHGQYLKGAETVNAPQNEFTDMNQSGYDYTKDVDKSKYSNGTNFNLWDFSFNCINKFYVLTQAQVEQLSTELYTIMSSVSSDMPIERYNQTVFLTQNPIDCIVSIKRFPVDVPYIGTAATLKLGSQTTSISAHYLSKPCNVYYFNFSNSSDTGLYQENGGSFLDFEPYTKIQINVPFCGSFDVPCNYFNEYGGVTIALLIDFVSGACNAFLMVNGNVVDSIQGSCGVDVPLSGLQTATIDSQIFNASMSKQKQDNNFALSMLGGAAAIALGVATGGAAAVIGGAGAMVGGILNKDINDKSIDYNLQHMQAPIKQVSSASAVIGRANDMRCKMIISRPEYIDGYNTEVYADTIGFACLLNGHVSDFTGLTVGDINVGGIAATAEEKEMIKRKFSTGVYL